MPLRHAAMLEVNEFLVLDYIREHDRTSRTEIAAALDLSPSSVSRMVGRLLRAGLVMEGGSSPSDRGRPRGVISFNRRAGAVMAIDLGATICHGALADLAGDLVYEDVRPTPERGEAFTTMLATLDDLTAEAARAGVPVAALAVGVPAILDPETGIGLAGPSVAWEAFDIVSELARRVEVPYVVENDVNLAALAQAWRGDGQRIPDFFTLYLGAGVGGAVVANGSLVKGRHNGAGEIGFVLADLGQAGGGRAGPVDRLEAVVCEAGLLARARALADTDGHGQAAPGSVTDLFTAAAAGDPVAAHVVAELLDHVGMALVAVGAIVDPELVILDGPVGRSLAPYVPTLAAALERRLPRAPRLVVSRLQGDSTLVGAVAAALELARRQAAPAALFGAFSTSGAPMG